MPASIRVGPDSSRLTADSRGGAVDGWPGIPDDQLLIGGLQPNLSRRSDDRQRVAACLAVVPFAAVARIE